MHSALSGRCPASPKCSNSSRSAVWRIPFRQPDARHQKAAQLRPCTAQSCGLQCRGIRSTGRTQIVRAAQGSGASQEKLLEGKVVLVTGASRGIGAAVAKNLAKQSPTLVLSAEDGAHEEISPVIEACRRNGASVVEVLADLSRPEGVELLANNAQRHGTVDIVVHAAAVYDAMTFDFGDKGQGPLDGDPNAWDRQASLSYSAPLRLTRRLAPPMVEKGAGLLVFLSSAEALGPWPQAPAFASTKWGLRGFTKSIYPILKEKGVKTLTIHPPGGGGKLNPENAADKLVEVLRNAKSAPDSVPEEVEVTD